LIFDYGCKPGDVIAIFSPNSIEWMQMAAATLRVGAVLAAVNHMLKPGMS
jgi:acyl-coenzyme A synthetase/AMP-(fatty) acid ligase